LCKYLEKYARQEINLIVSDDVAKKSYHLSILMIKCQMQKHPQV